MFKQKIIPLLPAALLLASCNNTINIKIDTLIEESKGIALMSKKFSTAKGQNFNFSVLYEKYDKNEEDYSCETIISFVNDSRGLSLAKKIIRISIDGKKLEKFTGNYNQWADKEDSEKDGYYFFGDSTAGQVIDYIHIGTNKNSVADIVITSALNAENVYACAINE